MKLSNKYYSSRGRGVRVIGARETQDSCVCFILRPEKGSVSETMGSPPSGGKVPSDSLSFTVAKTFGVIIL